MKYIITKWTITPLQFPQKKNKSPTRYDRELNEISTITLDNIKKSKQKN